MLRSEIDSNALPRPHEDAGYQEAAEMIVRQQLIVKYEHEIARETLETVRFADGNMGIISSPNHFGQVVDDVALIEKMVAFESERLGLDPDLSLLSQLGEENFELLNASLSISTIVKDVETHKITLRQAATAVVTSAADLAGIHQRWVSINNEQKSREEVVARSVAIGVKLLREYVTNFIEEPEGIILTSSFLPKDMAEVVIDQALKEGVLTKKPEFFEVRLYCAGTAAAMAIALKHPKFSAMSSVAIMALEPISALLEDQHSGFDNFQSQVIFSDDFLIARMKPSAFQLSPHSVLQTIDDGGVIELESWSEFPGATDWDAMPNWAQDLLRTSDQAILHFDDTHLIVSMRSPEPGQPRGRMKAKPTAKFFSFHSPRILFELLMQHAILHLYNHEPSEGVLQLIERALARMIKKNPEKIKQSLESVPEFSRVNQGNSSSGTLLRQLMELAKQERLDAEAFLEPTLVFAPGAGATFAALVIERAKQKIREITIFSAPDSD